MNLVKMIEDQVSGGTLDRLSSALGTDAETTGRAVSAAVPSLLAGLANLGSSGDGLKKLTSVLGGLDTSSLGNLSQMLGGDASSLVSKGLSLLGSLFGDNMISNLAGAIGRYAGLDAGMAKKVIAVLAPLVLGKVATQWKSQGGTPSALSGLLAEQERHIPSSLPAGFSLADIPGLSTATEAVQSTAHATRRAADSAKRATPSMASWLLPVAGVLLVGFLLWQFLKSRPDADRETAQRTANQRDPVAATRREAGTSAAQQAAGDRERVTARRPVVEEAPTLPNAVQLTDEVNATAKTMGETFASIKDAASAEAAAPKLEELSAKLDSIKKSMAQLPETGQAALQSAVKDQLGPIQEQAETALKLPGLSERIIAILNQIVRTLQDWNVNGTAG